MSWCHLEQKMAILHREQEQIVLYGLVEQIPQSCGVVQLILF